MHRIRPYTLLLLCATLAQAAPMDRQVVINAQARQAICNDGSAYAYHRRNGSGSGANNWVIWLEGGGACQSAAECTERNRTDPGKMTSEKSATLNRGGIIGESESQNPEFYNWNHVFLSYCTSDIYSGNRAASAETGGFHFRGLNVVRATIEDLLLRTGGAPSLADAGTVIFGGSSAGGAGQLNHLDWVADQIKAVRPTARVVGFTDSSMHPTVLSYTSTQLAPILIDSSNVAASGGGASYTFWGAVVPPACVAQYPTQPFACLAGPIVLASMRTPNFIHEDQLDEERLRRLGVITGNPNPPTTCQSQGYPASVRGWLNEYTEIVRSSLTQPKFGGAFSAAAGFHTGATNSERWDTYRVDGQTMRRTFLNWFNDSGLKVVIEPSNCQINPTGAWYDPAQSGHGLLVEQLPGRRVLAAWYTFDPAGQQAWFLGDGSFDGTTATLTNIRPAGTNFPPNFNASAVSNTAFGTMTITFNNCASGKVDFDLPQGFGRGSMSLTRLTKPIDINCEGVAGEASTGKLNTATGAWYDPAQSGHGLFIESLPAGQVLATWYTFPPVPGMGQAWMLGTGTISGNSVTLSMQNPQGGRFIPNFNPATVTRPTLGNATITLDTCDSGRVEYDFGQGFGRGTMTLRRLSKAMGVVCLP